MGAVEFVVKAFEQFQNLAGARRKERDLVSECLNRIEHIRKANNEVIKRGSTPGSPWQKLLNGKYNQICIFSARLEEGVALKDPFYDADRGYFDLVCYDSDVKTVCKQKDAPGRVKDRLSNSGLKNRIWEITIPDLPPQELQERLEEAIKVAERLNSSNTS